MDECQPNRQLLARRSFQQLARVTFGLQLIQQDLKILPELIKDEIISDLKIVSKVGI